MEPTFWLGWPGGWQVWAQRFQTSVVSRVRAVAPARLGTLQPRLAERRLDQWGPWTPLLCAARVPSGLPRGSGRALGSLYLLPVSLIQLEGACNSPPER